MDTIQGSFVFEPPVITLNSMKRAVTRYFETGRYLSTKYIQSIGNKPMETYEWLKEHGDFDSYTMYDNNVKFGEPAKLVERKVGR